MTQQSPLTVQIMTIPPLSALIISAGMVLSAGIASTALSRVDAQGVKVPVAGNDVLLTMPVLADKGWFLHASNGRVRACSADGASIAGDRPGPKCSRWSDADL
jgi:hypothetical protein